MYSTPDVNSPSNKMQPDAKQKNRVFFQASLTQGFPDSRAQGTELTSVSYLLTFGSESKVAEISHAL